MQVLRLHHILFTVDLCNALVLVFLDVAQFVSLFKMTIKEQSAVLPALKGKKVYLGLAKTVGNKLAMKPQNLLVNLPLESPT